MRLRDSNNDYQNDDDSDNINEPFLLILIKKIFKLNVQEQKIGINQVIADAIQSTNFNN